MRVKDKITSRYVIAYTVGKTFTYLEVADVAKKFGNPDILSGCLFTDTFEKDQLFKLERVPLSKLFAGQKRKELPSDVMFLESGPEYDDNKILTGGDEFYAKKFAEKYPSGDTAGPIIVKPEGGKFQIIDGRHRSRAAFLRGEKTIQAFVAKI